jgi:hypothetical protein
MDPLREGQARFTGGRSGGRRPESVEIELVDAAVAPDLVLLRRER